MADLYEILSVIIEQERTIYKCKDYLSPNFHGQQRESNDPLVSSQTTLSNCSVSTQSTHSSASAGVNELWREKICEWSYQVVDHFDFSRETVAISISYLDRFLASRPVNRKTFQLAAMTTLYLAIKLFEPGRLKISDLVKLSQGYFAPEHIIAMEEALLRALSWHVHPPTSLCVISYLVPLLSKYVCHPSVRHDIIEFARFLTELSVCDYFFVTKTPSSIAIAALFNAFDSIDRTRLPSSIAQAFFSKLPVLFAMDDRLNEVLDCRSRLHELYKQGGYEQHRKDSDRVQSPNCVASQDLDHTSQCVQSSAYSDACVDGPHNNISLISHHNYTVSVVERNMSENMMVPEKSSKAPRFR